MPSLPPDYIDALRLLARASERHRAATGRRMVIVGGAAVSFYTQGAVQSGDFDMVCDSSFEMAMLAEGFSREDRAGYLLVGYYHPAVPQLGFQIVSGALFDGRTDKNKVLPVKIEENGEVLFPPVEDLIADRLAQYTASGDKDSVMLEQARALLSLAEEYDRTYLIRRIQEEGGDPSLIGLS